MIILLMIMLALPVGLVVWGLKRPSVPESRGPDSAAVEAASEPLKQSLETVAEESLAPQPLVEENFEQTLVVVDPADAAKLAGVLARELGATALPAEDSGDGSVRILLTIPAGARGEFARRLSLAVGDEFQIPEGRGVVVVWFVRSARP